MRSDEQMASIVTRSTKDLHLEIARKWGIPATVMAGTTFGLGVTMMIESGYTEDQIVEIVHDLVSDLSALPGRRGAS